MDVDARLYDEVIDDIRKKQTDLVLENLVFNKLLEKIWNEEGTLKSLTFSWISWISLIFGAKGRYSAIIDIM